VTARHAFDVQRDRALRVPADLGREPDQVEALARSAAGKALEEGLSGDAVLRETACCA